MCMEKVKLVPYGIASFLQVRKKNNYYSDKVLEAWFESNGYAESEVVRRLLNGTQLHLVVVQIKGYEMTRAGEVVA